MSISSISSFSSLSSSQLYGITSPADPFQNNDTTQSTSATQPPAGGGRFITAIRNALAQAGISLDPSSTTTSSSASTSSATDASSTPATGTTDDAAATFLQSLLAALHAQSSGTPPQAADDASSSAQSASSQASVDATGKVAGGHGHHGHGGGHIEKDVQSLIQELGSATTTAASTTDGTTSSAATSTSASSALDALETSFNALLAQNGVSSTGNDSLSTFLQSLAQGLDGAPKTGNVVSTVA